MLWFDFFWDDYLSRQELDRYWGISILVHKLYYKKYHIFSILKIFYTGKKKKTFIWLKLIKSWFVHYENNFLAYLSTYKLATSLKTWLDQIDIRRVNNNENLRIKDHMINLYY